MRSSSPSRELMSIPHSDTLLQIGIAVPFGTRCFEDDLPSLGGPSPRRDTSSATHVPAFLRSAARRPGLNVFSFFRGIQISQSPVFPSRASPEELKENCQLPLPQENPPSPFSTSHHGAFEKVASWFLLPGHGPSDLCRHPPFRYRILIEVRRWIEVVVDALPSLPLIVMIRPDGEQEDWFSFFLSLQKGQYTS